MLRREELLLRQAGLVLEVAANASTIRDAQSLRYQVFCRERRIFLPSPGEDLDRDEFDHRASHVVIRRVETSEVIATSRVVRAHDGSARGSLPMHRYCCPSLFRSLPTATMGEISRFAISKQARLTNYSGPLLRLGLLQGILRASKGMGLTHWCALMEPSLMRLLGATGVKFVPLGPMVEAYGQRVPCAARIDMTIADGRQSHPHYYNAIAAAA